MWIAEPPKRVIDVFRPCRGEKCLDTHLSGGRWVFVFWKTEGFAASFGLAIDQNEGKAPVSLEDFKLKFRTNLST